MINEKLLICMRCKIEGADEKIRKVFAIDFLRKQDDKQGVVQQ